MLEKLGLIQMAGALARHGAARQAVIAENVANADTPGYRARDLAPFSETYRGTPSAPMRTTRAGHIAAGGGTARAPEAEVVYRPGAASPNGNSVSIETEMFAATEAKSAHDRALAIYKSTLNILRSSASTRG